MSGHVYAEDERQIYSIYIAKLGYKLRKIKECDSWNLIQKYWQTLGKKLKKKEPGKNGFIVAELRINGTFVFERKTNNRQYLLKIVNGPANGLEIHFCYRKSAFHYADIFKRMGNHCIVYRYMDIDYHNKVQIHETIPRWKFGALILYPERQWFI